MSKGGAPASDVMVRLTEVLEAHPDGIEWEQLIREAGKVIPPGKAMRKAERQRASTGAADGRKRQASDDRIIAIGRRAIVVQTTHSMKVKRWRDDDGVQWAQLLEVPPSVARDRARARAHHHFDPVDISDEIAAGADINALLAELSPPQLLRVAQELANRERRRAILGGTANPSRSFQWPSV